MKPSLNLLSWMTAKDKKSLTANQNLVIARVAPEDRKQILETLRPILVRYAKERENGERFGDFCIRTGYSKPTRSGATFHDDVPVEAIAK